MLLCCVMKDWRKGRDSSEKIILFTRRQNQPKTLQFSLQMGTVWAPLFINYWLIEQIPLPTLEHFSYHTSTAFPFFKKMIEI